MKALRADLVKMAEALGFRTAGKWNRAKMEEKLVEIAAMEDVAIEDDDDLAKLLKQVVKAGGKVVVCKDAAEMNAEDDDEAEASESDDDLDDKTAEEINAELNEVPVKAKKAKAPKAAGPKGEGVIATILASVKAATKTKPATKDSILASLVAKFPDRPADSMKNTITVQMGGRLKKEKGLNIVGSTKEGWYVDE